MKQQKATPRARWRIPGSLRNNLIKFRWSRYQRSVKIACKSKPFETAEKRDLNVNFQGRILFSEGTKMSVYISLITFHWSRHLNASLKTTSRKVNSKVKLLFKKLWVLKRLRHNVRLVMESLTVQTPKMTISRLYVRAECNTNVRKIQGHSEKNLTKFSWSRHLRSQKIVCISKPFNTAENEDLTVKF